MSESERRTLVEQAPAEPTAGDVERLAREFESAMARRCGVESELAAHGWELSARRAWVVEARRGQESEQALGATLDEALERLGQLLLMDEAPHVP